MLRVGVFVDTSNLYHFIHKKFNGRKLDYSAFLSCSSGTIVHKNAYGICRATEAKNFILKLKSLGFCTRFIKKQSRRPNLNIDMAMDIVRCVDKLDIVILGTSDKDIEPLAKWLKEKGISIWIIACDIPKDLKMIATEVIEINEVMLEDKNEITRNETT